MFTYKNLDFLPLFFFFFLSLWNLCTALSNQCKGYKILQLGEETELVHSNALHSHLEYVFYLLKIQQMCFGGLLNYKN